MNSRDLIESKMLTYLYDGYISLQDSSSQLFFYLPFSFQGDGARAESILFFLFALRSTGGEVLKNNHA